MIKLNIKKSNNVYGIKLSEWRALFDRGECPNYFYYEKEINLRKELDSIFNTSREDCHWNLHSIGSHFYEKGFFSIKHGILCGNCFEGFLDGNISAVITQINKVKESANPSKRNSPVLEKDFVLWSIKVHTKCNHCDIVHNWESIVNNEKYYWNFNHFSDFFVLQK